MDNTKSYYKTIQELENEENAPISIAMLEEQFDIEKVTGVSWNTENDAVSSITIYFEKEDPELTKFIKNAIINTLGSNHTKTIEFTSVTAYNEVYGLYTYRGDVFVLKEGYDIDFESLKLSEQIKINDMFEAKEWVENNTLQ